MRIRKGILFILLSLIIVTTQTFSYTIRDTLKIIKQGSPDTMIITNSGINKNIIKTDTAIILKTSIDTSTFNGIIEKPKLDTVGVSRDSVGNYYYDDFLFLDTSVWSVDSQGGGYVHIENGVLHLYSNGIEGHGGSPPNDSICISKNLEHDTCEIKIIIDSINMDPSAIGNKFYFGILDSSTQNKDSLFYITSYQDNPTRYSIEFLVNDTVFYTANSVCFVIDTIFVYKIGNYYEFKIGDSTVCNSIHDNDYSNFYISANKEAGDLYIDKYEENEFVNNLITTIRNKVMFMYNDSIVAYIDTFGIHVDSLHSYIYADSSNYASNLKWHNVINDFTSASQTDKVMNIYSIDNSGFYVSDSITVLNIYTAQIHGTFDLAPSDKPLVINFMNNTIVRDSGFALTEYNNFLQIVGDREVTVNNYHGAMRFCNYRSAQFNNCYFYTSRYPNKMTYYALQLSGGGSSKKYQINNCYIETDLSQLGYTGALYLNNLNGVILDIRGSYIYNHGNASFGAAMMVTDCDNDTINIYNSILKSQDDCLNGVIDGGFSENTQINVYNSSIIAKDNLLGQLGVMADWGLNVNLYNSYIEAPSGFWTYRICGYGTFQYSHIKIDGCNVVVNRYALRPSYGKMEAYNSTFTSTKTTTDNDTGIIWITPAGDNDNLGDNFYDSLIVDNCRFISHGVIPVLFSKATNDDQANDSICSRVYVNIANSQFISNRDTLINTLIYPQDSFYIVLDNVATNISQYKDGSYMNFTFVNDIVNYTNSIDAPHGFMDTITTDIAKIHKADIDTLTADSIRAMEIVIDDTFYLGGYKFYHNSGNDYIYTDAFGLYANYLFANITLETKYARATHFAPRSAFPLNIQCDYNANDSIIFILQGMNDDTVATIDSFNTTNFERPVNIDTLTADSITAREIVGDTIWVGDEKVYDGGAYLSTGYLWVSNSLTADYLFNVKFMRNVGSNPLNINCGNKYDDSLLFILTGAGGDTVATIDSFNTTNYYLPVKYKQPVRLPLGITILPDTFVVDEDTIINIQTGMMVIDTTGGDTLKVFLNGTWEAITTN